MLVGRRRKRSALHRDDDLRDLPLSRRPRAQHPRWRIRFRPARCRHRGRRQTPELVRREPEVVPGFPDRLIAIDAKAAKELKKRTLTNLYNQRPAWLAQAHERLDSAVAAAYGWPSDINEEEALKKLLELNLSRSA